VVQVSCDGVWVRRRRAGGQEGAGPELANPGPEGGDVGEDVEAASFGEQAVVRRYQDGGVVVGVVEDPDR